MPSIINKRTVAAFTPVVKHTPSWSAICQRQFLIGTSDGICAEFKGDRGTKSKPIPHFVYGLMTTSLPSFSLSPPQDDTGDTFGSV